MPEAGATKGNLAHWKLWLVCVCVCDVQQILKSSEPTKHGGADMWRPGRVAVPVPEAMRSTHSCVHASVGAIAHALLVGSGASVSSRPF